MLYKYLFKVSLIAITLMFVGCLKPDKFSDIPSISNATFDRLNAYSAHLYPNDSSKTKFIVNVNYTDGDGDLGGADVSAFLVDSRTGFIDSFAIPYLTPAGDFKSISGHISFNKSFGTYCIPITGSPGSPNATYKNSDTLTYNLYIKDRSGNVSNTITTSPPIYILCKQ